MLLKRGYCFFFGMFYSDLFLSYKIKSDRPIIEYIQLRFLMENGVKLIVLIFVQLR